MFTIVKLYILYTIPQKQMNLTIADFYNLPTLFTIPKPIFFLLKRSFLRELTSNGGTPNWASLNQLEDKKADSKITIKVHKADQACLNSVMPLNQWIQASVWYDNQPCMIIRNDEYNFKRDSLPKQFITDTEVHKQMLWYIFSFLKEDNYKDMSIRNQGVYNMRQLNDGRLLDEPQVVEIPGVYDMQLAQQAINLQL